MLGKTRRPEMRTALEDYVKRIRRHAPVEMTEVRDAADLYLAVAVENEPELRHLAKTANHAAD